jgi:hypothetical protein
MVGAIPPLSQFVLVLYENNKMKEWPGISVHGICKTYQFKITNYKDNKRSKLLNVALGFEKVLSKDEYSWLEMAKDISLEMRVFFESINVRLLVLSLWLRKEGWRYLSCSYTALR